MISLSPIWGRGLSPSRGIWNHTKERFIQTERPSSKGYGAVPCLVPVARPKKEDSSALAAVVGVVGLVWQTVQQVRRIASGEADRVHVAGHYRKNGRGGHMGRRS